MIRARRLLLLAAAALSVGVAGAGARAEPASRPAAAPALAAFPPGCAAVDGGYDPGGSLGWVPTCAGAWLVDPASPLPTMAVVGVPSKTGAAPFAPDFSAIGTTQALIQGIARKEEGAEVALTVNFDVAHGRSGGARAGAARQKVGIADFVRAHPGPGGARPGDTWAFNPDIQVAAGSGNLLAINTEADFNNFNDCSGPGCFMVMLWHNYLSSHPITADTYISGESDRHVGTATVAGTRLTRTGGVPFTPDTTTIEVDGRLVRVDAFVGPSVLTLAEDLGTRPAAATAWRSHLVHTAILISGDNAVAEHDLLSSSSGYYGIAFAGHHDVLVSAAADSAPYAMVARPGQAVCLDGVDGCLLHVGGDRLQYQAKGNPAVQVVGVPAPGGATFAVIRNAAGSAGPSVSVEGAAPAAPLNLAGKGGAPVAIVGSPLKLPVYTIAALPPCRADALGEEAFVADTSAREVPAWHGAVLGGGSATVRSVVACNGVGWQYE